MKTITGLSVLLAVTLLLMPEDVFARGFGGGGRGGGGGMARGGGGARPAGGGGRPPGGGARPASGGGMSRPSGGGGRPNLGGGGGNRPNAGSMANHSPSFSHPIGGGSARPGGGAGNFGGTNRPSTLPGNANRPNIGGGANRPGGGNIGQGGGNRPEIGGGENRPGGGNIGPGGGNRPNIGGGNRPGGGNNIGQGGNRPNIGNGNIGGGNRGNIGSGNRVGGGIGNNTNIGNRTNIGRVGNNNFNNVHNNINIASNRPYNNNWHNGNWNGNWNRPGGGGYWNGWAHGYARGYWHGGWGGYWHGGWGGYWGRPWYASPIAWGLGAWAIGSVIYNSGYASYSNPYYGGGSSGDYYDYSQPITVINQQPDATAAVAADPGGTATTAAYPPEVQEGTSHTDLAREAFKNGNYKTASNEIDLAIKALPKDAALHEFRALIFFATKDYKQAAGTLYAVLSAGPGWDWTTLSGMYASTATYTEQLRTLEDYVKANPMSADAHFVLAYQYLTCGHTEAAKTQYEHVLNLQPMDQLSAQLAQLLGADPAAATTGQPTPQPPEAEASPEENATPPAEIDAAKVIGKWTAKRPDGSSFALNLTPDSKFTWGFTQGTKKQEFGGKYSVDGAILVLERTDGSQMPGLVTLANGGGFNFKLYGGPPDDPGLDFKK